MVEQWNSNGATVGWNSGTVMVEQWNSDAGTVMVEQWNSNGGTVEQCGGKVE